MTSNDKCEECGSRDLMFHPARRPTLYEPGCNDHWECKTCGHTQPYDKDYDDYRDDSSYHRY